MDISFMNVQRCWLVGSLAVLGLLLGSCWLAGSSEEVPVLKDTPAQEPDNRAAVTDVKGLAQAHKAGVLRNPFSLRHETEQEAAAVSQIAETSGSKADFLPVQTGAKVTAAAKPVSPAPAEEIVFCGIAQGNGEQLALLQVGGTAAALALGESLNGWQVIAIDDAGVTVSRGGQVRKLGIDATAFMQEGAQEK